MEIAKLPTIVWHIVMMMNMFMLVMSINHKIFNIHEHYFKLKLAIVMDEGFCLVSLVHYLWMPAL